MDATIVTKHNIVDILKNPQKYICEEAPTEILILPDEEAAGGQLRFLVGKDGDDGYYIGIEDDYALDIVFPANNSSLLESFVQALNDNLKREP